MAKKSKKAPSANAIVAASSMVFAYESGTGVREGTVEKSKGYREALKEAARQKPEIMENIGTPDLTNAFNKILAGMAVFLFLYCAIILVHKLHVCTRK